jgi:RNA polymerase sigma factor (sigma-70 family)
MATGELHAVIHHLRRIAQPGGPDGVTDAQLLERFLGHRDETAFELLLWRHGAKVLSLCRRVLRHEQEAEDAFQATFLVVVRKARSITQRQSLGSWLYKVAYRVALAAKSTADRRAAREVPLAEVAGADSAPEAAWRELAPVLDEGINHLPEKYRTPFVLCYFQGKTIEQTATQLGCPPGTVGTRLARARERLRKHLAARGLSVGAAALGVVLSDKAARATVPASLVAAVSRLSGPSGTAVPPRVAALTQGALKSMLLSKLKMALAGAFLLVVLGSGIGGVAYPLQAADDPPAAGAPRRAEPPRASDPMRDPAVRNMHDWVVANYDGGKKAGLLSSCTACHADPFTDPHRDWLRKLGSESQPEKTTLKGWGATIDPGEDCKFTVGKDSLKITVPGDGGARKPANTPRVVRAVEGNFIIQVKVTMDRPAGDATLREAEQLPYHGAGLLVWADDKNYVRLERADLLHGNHTYSFAHLEQRAGGQAEEKKLAVKDKETYLRLERRDGKVYGSFSPDGVNWKALDPVKATLPDRVYVGVVALHNTAPGFEVEFSGLKLFREVDR